MASFKKPSLLTRQPAKGFYSLFFLVSTMVKLPFLLLYYAVPSNRPVRTWSYRAALFSHITRILFQFVAKIEMKTPRSLEPGPDGDNFVVIPPAPENLLQGVLADPREKPASIGALWLPKPYHGADGGHDDSRVLLHFHGGAFITLSPRLGFARKVPSLLCSHLPAAAALSVQYRLASDGDGIFPAPLQDAIAAYWFLVNEIGISASQIVLSGDSSGAHIVISLLRYMAKHPDLLPLPRAALLSSPWVNLTDEACIVELRPQNKSDYLSTEFLSWGARCFRAQDMAPDNEWISPLHHPFHAHVPIWVQAGTAEYFYPDIVTWVDEMRAVQGNRIAVYDQPDAPHSAIALAEEMDMKDSILRGLEQAQAFVDSIAAA